MNHNIAAARHCLVMISRSALASGSQVSCREQPGANVRRLMVTVAEINDQTRPGRLFLAVNVS